MSKNITIVDENDNITGVGDKIFEQIGEAPEKFTAWFRIIKEKTALLLA